MTPSLSNQKLKIERNPRHLWTTDNTSIQSLWLLNINNVPIDLLGLLCIERKKS
jgi:hypothetical protein